MIVKEIRLFGYKIGTRKGLKLLFSCLCCCRNTMIYLNSKYPHSQVTLRNILLIPLYISK